jgi:hypothetical protein
MAPDDFWARKRRQEEEEAEEREKEKEREEREAKKNKLLGVTDGSGKVRADTIGNLAKEATLLIEQLNHLYNQFRAGVLALPPVEKRSRLNQTMNLLTLAPKATPAERFQFSSVHASYEANCSRWDKMMHDIESGKIKKTAGPKRG